MSRIAEKPPVVAYFVASFMRTFHKGLLLVFVPLAFETVFISYVAKCMFDSFTNTDKIVRTQAVVAEITKIDEGIRRATLDCVAYSVKASTSENLNQLVGEKPQVFVVSKAFAKIRRLVADDASDVKALLEFEEVYADFERMVGKIKVGIDRGGKLSENEKISTYLSIDEKFKQLTTYTRNFIDRQRKLGEQMLNEHLAMRQSLGIAIGIGILVNVLIAFFSVRFFTTSIGRRVDSVVDNNLRFASGKALTAPLSGNDEIADLDHAFRQMARTVHEAREKEQAILSNAVDIVCTIDDTGRITQANPALLNALSGRRRYSQSALARLCHAGRATKVFGVSAGCKRTAR
ncbi:MAG: hypothetical protein SGJ27_02795 [Candidatus Melainabacteria bacterium]|nr:hypothetical protein [Candidatus Melainabacteria bacterium]